MFRFLHAADIHLDSPLRGLERYEGAPVAEIRQATRRALENLVRLAIDQRVQFVVLAGDLYDGDWRDHNTGLYFARQLGRLREAGIATYIIAGNHDAANRMTRSLRLPANPAGDAPLLAHAEPETRRLDNWQVAIHGQSFRNAAETGNLAVHYPAPLRGWFNMGVLHTSLEGDAAHAVYAPCSLDDLRFKGYDYWALGHIHTRRVVSETPYVVYPGNVQGRHIREPGAKGCLLVTVDDRQQVSAEFHALDVFRWALCDVDCRGAANLDEVLVRCSGGLTSLARQHAQLPLGVRVQLWGACEAHRELAGDLLGWTGEVRNAANHLSGEQIWIEKIKLQTSLPGRQAPAIPEGPIAELVACLAETSADDEQLRALGADLEPLRKKLPVELTQDLDGLRLQDPAWIREILAEAEALLLERLGRVE